MALRGYKWVVKWYSLVGLGIRMGLRLGLDMGLGGGIGGIVCKEKVLFW